MLIYQDLILEDNMTPALTIIVAILGFLSALALLAVVILFLYVIRELRRILDWLREFAKMYLGIEIETEKKSPATGFVKMEQSWDENKDGKD